MLNELTSSNIKISFDFEVMEHQNRELDIQIKGYVHKIEYAENFFNWFIEDLIFFLDKNKFQRRWDYGLVRVHGIKNLDLSEQENKTFMKLFKTITSWDMEAIYEDYSFKK